MPDARSSSSRDLLSRVTSDTTLLRAATTTGVVESFNRALALLGAIALMGVLDWPLLLVTLGVLAAVALGVAVVLPRIARATERAQAAVGAVGGALERVLGAIRTVKASGAEQRELGVVTAAATAAYDEGVAVARYTALVGVSSGFAVQLTFLAVLGVGGARVASGSLDVATLIAFLLYLFFLIGPVAALTMGATQLQAGLAAVARIDEVERLEVERDDDAPAPQPGARAHERAEPPPRPCRLATAPGGPSCTRSRSTSRRRRRRRSSAPRARARRRCSRCWSASTSRPPGRSRWRGRRCPRSRATCCGPGSATSSRRRRCSPARCARTSSTRPPTPATRRWPRSSRRRVSGRRWRACRTVWTPRSGTAGRRCRAASGQRIAIARALLRRPEVLLFDEATAQLDAANERALRETIGRAARRCAVLVIAHRLSTVVAAQQIVVLDDGRLRAFGTHGELVERDALYRELATTQLIRDRQVGSGAGHRKGRRAEADR